MVSLFKKLGTPALLFYALPYLMGILIVGTISQKWIGLHQSLEIFFFSWVIWLSVIPLPGGLMVMSAITLTLTLKFLLKSKWSYNKAGINLIHLGVLVLMIGGLGSLILKTESVILLNPQEQTNTAQDYVDTDFTILKNGNHLSTTNFKGIDAINDIPFNVVILSKCLSCEIVLRDKKNSKGWVGAAASMKLIYKKAPLNKEETIQGISFKVSGLKDNQNGKYLTFESFPKPPIFTHDNDTYSFIIERRKTILPFSITLNKFDKDLYARTTRARNYTSHLTITDGDKSFPAIITMNEPLRYKEHVLYQSSFIGDASVLAVVKNKAYIFPYIASLLIAFGLIWHTIILYRRKK